MPEIEIRCPICQKKGRVEVPEVTSGKGLMAVNVEEGIICDHNFIAYIDKNLNVRDRYVADFQIQIKKTTDKAEKKGLPEDTLDLDIIKYNLPQEAIANILRAIFVKKKILFLFGQDHLCIHFENFFKWITERSFEIQLEFTNKTHYRANKKQYKDYLVLKKNQVVRDKEKIIDPKSMKELYLLVDKFFEEEEIGSGMIVLKNEIRKFYLMAEYIIDYCQEQKKDKINSKKLIDSIADHFNIKITFPFLNLLVETIEEYFRYELPEISEVSDFLGFL